MDGKQKMSQFGSTTLAAAKTAGAGFPVFIAGQANKQIPASEIAGAADLSTVATNLGYVSAFIAVAYSEDASYTAGNVVWHDNAVYRANANTSGTWDSTKWDAVTIGTIFVALAGKANTSHTHVVADITDYKPIADGGTLTDGATVAVPNNAISFLSSSQSALTLNVNVSTSDELPNFGIEIEANAAITLTVTKTVGNGSPVELYPSEAGGNELESGKYYQMTCVGNCWTLAEFVPPTP